MPHPLRLLRLSIGLAVAAAGVLGVALSGAPGGVQAGPLGQGRLATVPCTSTSTLFATNLTSAEEVPPSGTNQTGTAVMQLQPDGVTLASQLTTTIPVGNVVAAHIHSPAPPGVNTSVRVNFFLGPQGTFTSPFNGNGFPAVTPDVLNDMRTGQAYVNIHTVAFPGGEIRGQIACLAPTVTPIRIVTLTPTPTPVPVTSVSAPTIIRIPNLPPLLPPLPPPPLLLPPPPLPPPPMGMGAPGQMGPAGPMGMGAQGQMAPAMPASNGASSTGAAPGGAAAPPPAPTATRTPTPAPAAMPPVPVPAGGTAPSPAAGMAPAPAAGTAPAPASSTAPAAGTAPAPASTTSPAAGMAPDPASSTAPAATDSTPSAAPDSTPDTTSSQGGEVSQILVEEQ